VIRPLLYLDVDGVLNPEPASINPPRRPVGFVTHRARPKGFEARLGVKPLRLWLNPDHGSWLLQLPVELVWATTWEHDANVWVAPHIGLPRLDVVEFGKGPVMPRRGQPIWKTEHVVKHACGRPFVWIDDMLGMADNEYVKENHNGLSLLIRPNPIEGLLQTHLDTVRTWAEGLQEQEGVKDEPGT